MPDLPNDQRPENAYQAWFRARVQEALDDPSPDIPDEEVAETFARLRRSKLRAQATATSADAETYPTPEPQDHAQPTRPSLVDHILGGEPWPEDLVELINERPNDPGRDVELDP